MTATRGLGLEKIACELDRIRGPVVAAKQREFPGIPVDDLENAYGDIVAEALQGSFANERQLGAWVREALRRDALDIVKSARFRTNEHLPADDAPGLPTASGPSAEDVVSGREARELLYEFLAQLSERDRTIGFLHLDPDYDYTPRRIAAALDLPIGEVRKTLDRVGARLRRFTDLERAPGGSCARRDRDVLAWHETGAMPLALRLHLRRCHACRNELRTGREAVRRAILPLIPAASLPAAARGIVARAYELVGAHPATGRTNEALARVRKAVPVGGGGGAAIAVKLAAATAVVGVTAALHDVTTTSHQPPTHRHGRAHRSIAPSAPPIVHVVRSAAIIATATTSTATTSTPTIESHTAPAVLPATATTTATTTRSTLPPAPNENPAVVSKQGSSGSGGGGTVAQTAIPPAPNANPASSAEEATQASPGGGGSSSSASGPPAPGGPPPP